MSHDRIPPQFIQYAADLLAETDGGLTGPNIVKATTAYAVEYDVDIPHVSYPFDAPNKRTALYENVMRFEPAQQYRIIKELCDHHAFKGQNEKARRELKIKLVTRYRHLADEDQLSEISETLIEETRHWLDDHQSVLSLYNDALEKYDAGIFHRNLLDDLRLALEKLLQSVFGNSKSLENQISFIGAYIKQRGGSKELSNMFVKLVDYYANYQNSYVKHDDAIIEEEIEFVFEITSSFMKHLIRLSSVEVPDG